MVTDRYKNSLHFVLLALLVLNLFQALKHKMKSTVKKLWNILICNIIIKIAKREMLTLMRNCINRYISAKPSLENLKTAETAMVILPQFSKNATKMTMLIISQSSCYVKFRKYLKQSFKSRPENSFQENCVALG